MRIATWSPLSPKEVLALADQPNLKLVTSPADLCEVLVAALQKFNAALHGAQTPVRDLWDRQKGKDIFRPIDENALSDVITRFLRAELGSSGIFANREVEVTRAPGSARRDNAPTSLSTRFAAAQMASRSIPSPPSSRPRVAGTVNCSRPSKDNCSEIT